MGKWSEKLHPRGKDGKFAKLSAKAAKASANLSEGANNTGGYDRKARKSRSRALDANLKKAGADRRTRRAFKNTQRGLDKGKIVYASPDGRIAAVHPADRRKAAAYNRGMDQAAKRAIAKNPRKVSQAVARSKTGKTYTATIKGKPAVGAKKKSATKKK